MISHKMLAIFGRGPYKGLAILPVETVKKVCDCVSLMKDLKARGEFIPNAIELRGEQVYITAEDLEKSLRFVTVTTAIVDELETLWGKNCEVGDCPFRELAEGERVLRSHLDYISKTSIKKKKMENKDEVEKKKADEKNVVSTTSSFSSPLKEQLRKELEEFEKGRDKILQQKCVKNNLRADTINKNESSVEELARIIIDSLFENL